MKNGTTKSIYPSDLKELGRRRQDESPEHICSYVRTTSRRSLASMPSRHSVHPERHVENDPRTSKPAPLNDFDAGTMGRYCSVVDLLPHDPPMVLLDRVEGYEDDFIHASLTIQESTLFLEDKRVPAYVALEYMAQAVAAWSGLMAAQQNQPPKIGFLLGTRRLVLDVPAFQMGEKLDIYGRLNYSDGEIAAFDCWVEIQGIRVVQASLNVFQPKNSEDFLKNL